jgi:hypothetical protein
MQKYYIRRKIDFFLPVYEKWRYSSSLYIVIFVQINETKTIYEQKTHF